MGKLLTEQLIRIPVISRTLLLTGSDSSAQCLPRHGDRLHRFRRVSVLKQMNKLGKKADLFAHSFREHGNLYCWL